MSTLGKMQKVQLKELPLKEFSKLNQPFEMFKEWYEQNTQMHPKEPTAVSLSTVDAGGWPQARTVLLKSFDSSGFVFFTNYQSAKGKQLLAAKKAQLLFFWDQLARQVRVWGAVEKTTEEESDEYFETRPYLSQIGAWASNQSEEIVNREWLEKRVEEFKTKYPPGKVPRPAHWGGFRVVPSKFEFWAGRENRLHDRFLMEKSGNGTWTPKRLSP